MKTEILDVLVGAEGLAPSAVERVLGLFQQRVLSVLDNYPEHEKEKVIAEIRSFRTQPFALRWNPHLQGYIDDLMSMWYDDQVLMGPFLIQLTTELSLGLGNNNLIKNFCWSCANAMAVDGPVLDKSTLSVLQRTQMPATFYSNASAEQALGQDAQDSKPSVIKLVWFWLTAKFKRQDIVADIAADLYHNKYLLCAFLLSLTSVRLAD